MEFEKYFGDFIGHLNEGIMVLDDRMRVIMRNRSAERILGVRINPRKKTAIGDLIEQENEEVLKLIKVSCLTCTEYKSHEITYHKKNRDIKIRLTMHTQWRKIASKGYYFFIIINDISEVWKLHSKEKQLRSQLQRTYLDQMENLRQIAQSVAHEVRNPIVSIGGYAQFLLKKFPPVGKDSADFRKYLSYINEDADRLSQIVRRVEKYSDISEINLDRENIVRLVRESFKFARGFANRRSVPFETSDIETREYFIFIDRAKIKKVLHNLLKHSVILSLKESPVRAQAQFTSFEFSLTIDTPTALPREEVPFLFNPFYSMQKQALNFDLAAAQRIAILHGGIITTVWKPENRLTIRLSIPREKRVERA